MADIGLALHNLTDWEAGLSGAISAIGPAAEQNVRLACLDLEREIKQRAPVDTGHLRASYTTQVTRSSDDVVHGLVGTNVEYAAYQEFLYTPHVRPAIDARRDTMLKIVGAQTMTEALGHLRR